MKQNVINSFENSDQANLFVEEIHLRYNRYRRDRFSILFSVIRKDSTLINQALSICIREKLFSANDFRDVVNYLKNTAHSTESASDSISQPTLSDYKYEVKTRSLSTYTSILGGHVQ